MGSSIDRALIAAVDLHGAGLREQFTDAEIESLWSIELDLGDGDGFFGCDEYVKVKEFLPKKNPSSIYPTLLDKLHRKIRGLCGGPPRERIMIDAASQALHQILHVDRSSRVLVMFDESNAEAGDAFFFGASELGASTALHLVRKEEDQNIIEMMRFGANILWADTIVDVSKLRGGVNGSAIKSAGKRYSNSFRIDSEMMIWGAMQADYSVMRKRADLLTDYFRGASYAHVTTESGTDLYLDIRNRRLEDDMDNGQGEHINIPAGEVYLAPREHTAYGRVIADVTIRDIGILDKPIALTIEEGRCVDVNSESAEQVDAFMEMLMKDGGARVLAELGIGINDSAVISGNILEDEKRYGTAHIAFGNNVHFPGGQNRSSIHFDVVFDNPTIDISYIDGSTRKVISMGKLTP